MEITLFGPSEREDIVELTAAAEDLDIRSEDYTLADGVRVVCRVVRNGDLVRVDGEAFADLSVQCARCLETFVQKVCGPFSFLVKRMPPGIPVPEDAAGETEEGEDLLYVGYDITRIDIADNVREAIILSLPLKVLCREDCKGLCVVCGQNLNESECGCRRETGDDRWKGLDKLFENKK